MHIHKTKGTCSHTIEVDVKDGIIVHCQIKGGCPGNTLGVQQLSIGQKASDVIQALKGIQCRNGTSCPDQLATALEAFDTSEKE